MRKLKPKSEIYEVFTQISACTTISFYKNKKNKNPFLYALFETKGNGEKRGKLKNTYIFLSPSFGLRQNWRENNQTK